MRGFGEDAAFAAVGRRCLERQSWAQGVGSGLGGSFAPGRSCGRSGWRLADWGVGQFLVLDPKWAW